MDQVVRGLMLALLGACAVSVAATPSVSLPTRAEVSMHHDGQSFLFDYGDFVVRVKYLSQSCLEWEQTKGPQAGLRGQEEYGHAAIRDDVVFFWWQEKDASVVTQVVDFARGAVDTTWTSPDRKLSGFQGKLQSA